MFRVLWGCFGVLRMLAAAPAADAREEGGVDVREDAVQGLRLHAEAQVRTEEPARRAV